MPRSAGHENNRRELFVIASPFSLEASSPIGESLCGLSHESLLKSHAT